MALRTCCFFRVIARSVPDYLGGPFVEVNTDAHVSTREDARKTVENVVAKGRAGTSGENMREFVG